MAQVKENMPRKKSPKKKSTPAENDNAGAVKLPDPVALSHALLDAYTRSKPLFESFIQRQGQEWGQGKSLDPMNIGSAYIEFMNRLMADPQRFWELQGDYWGKWMRLWQTSAANYLGEAQREAVIEPEKGDRRFKAPEWQENALFDFIKQSYLLTCQWMNSSVHTAQGLDEKKRQKLAFTTRLFADALSPSNFLMTNPEVLKETVNTGGENLIKGLENLLEDLERGQGELKISTTNYKTFEPGRNLATTPGRVIYQNDLIQLIQYEPSTEKVFKKPLLIIPPWINKYYILDLRPDNSLIKWAVGQGHTVFTISWVNPSADLAHKGFEDYMEEGILDSLRMIEKITGEPDCNVIGYCLGGTLLAIALAYLTARGEADKIASATYLTTLIDFENSGDMKLFLDEEQLTAIDKTMAEKGVFEARQLQQTFSLLRANDLIWSFVVNNYLMGKEPFPFDLLYWNDDSTNMPAAMHSYYLRNMYQKNLLTQPGGLKMKNVPIDIGAVKTPAYFLSTKEDHIAPWQATYEGAHLFSGPVTFTLAASGHIAGVVNAPEKEKYCYWTNDTLSLNPSPLREREGAKRQGEGANLTPDEWLKTTQEHKGSWWPHWQKWVENYAGEKVPARKPAKGLEAAPGSFVKVKA